MLCSRSCVAAVGGACVACAVLLEVRDSALGCRGPMRVVSRVCVANQVLHTRLIKIFGDEVLTHQDELTISVTRLSVLHMKLWDFYSLL